jgi:hypothetical protein
MTKNVVTLVLLILVLACAIYQTMCTQTTAKAERIRSETITRAALGSFTDQIDVMEEEESKRDDYISAVLPVRRSFVDSAVVPQRKVNKLMKLRNYIKKAVKGKPKSQVPLSMNNISEFEIRACKEASQKGILFNKAFERKLSSSTSSTLSSSSPTKHRHSSVSFYGEGPFVQLGGAAYCDEMGVSSAQNVVAE